MNKLPAAANLTDAEYNQLLQTYSNHNSELQLEERAEYDIAFLTSAQSIGKGNLLVHYQNGKGFIYTKECAWVPMDDEEFENRLLDIARGDGDE